MIIREFNLNTGVSAFNESNLRTKFHAHPATEIIMAKSGVFTLKTKEKKLKNIRCALVKPNVQHALDAKDALCDIVMIEVGFVNLKKLLKALGNVDGVGDILAIDESILKDDPLDFLKSYATETYVNNFDLRIVDCIRFIKRNINVAPINNDDLAEQVGLSPSRLSHLFKAQVGISIRKYITWLRMKLAVDYMIKAEMHLTEAAYTAGFYDAAHFSKHFKEMFGIKPSRVYNNSSFVQDILV